MKKPQTCLTEFRRFQPTLELFAIYHGMEEYYLHMALAADDEDLEGLAYRARKFIYNLPEHKSARIGSFYVLRSIGNVDNE